MKIVAVRTHALTLPLHTTFVTALRRTSAIETLVVEIVAEDGTSGFGEAPQVWQVTGDSVAGARACIEGPLTARILGRDVHDTVRLLRDVRGAVAGNTSAKAAVDIAVHDLLARLQEMPLVRWLGGTSMTVETDVTLPVGSTDALVDAAVARAADGFAVLKVKVGTDPHADVQAVTAIRAAVGPLIKIRLDANQGWTERQAIRAVRMLEDAQADVELVEQPIAAHDIDGLARVTARVATPIMADEAVYGVADLIEVIRRHAADMVNVKLAKCGGLAVGRTLLELAASAGLETIVGSMMESPVGVGAAASLAAAYGTSATSDLDAAWWLERPGAGGITYDRREVVLPNRPGLGIDRISDLEQK
jgi:L-alanine-DL-glutamate epimerase-like enolase superfamily enzyme